MFLEQFFLFLTAKNIAISQFSVNAVGLINLALLHCMRKYYSCCFTCLVLLFSCVLNAQVNTLYYMENVPARNVLNPAFIPVQKFYIDLPVVSGVAFVLGNNSVSVQDVLVKRNGMWMTYLHPDANHAILLNALKSTTNIINEYRVNLLGFGFRLPEGYFTFGLSERYKMGLNVPKSLVSLLLNGAPDTLSVNRYDFKKLGGDVSAYLEMAFGYSKRIDETWTVGGKFKVLFGQMHGGFSASTLKLNVGMQNIDIFGKGGARMTIPVAVTDDNGLPYVQAKDVQLNSILHPVGLGMAIDAGVVYKYDDRLQLSASIDDVGLIRWKKQDWSASLKSNMSFSGLNYSIVNTNDDWKQWRDSLKHTYSSSFGGNAYVSMLTATARLGADYTLLKRKVDLGFLLVNTFGGRYYYNELLASLNLRPAYWFNASLSYGLLNGNQGTLGLGVNVIAGLINFFVVTDYLPLYYTADGIPYKSKYVNGHVGVSLTFNDRKRKFACHCK
ncbi:MAG: OmpA/MotB domain protein [Bacteroidetes bacterium]|nr:OmpA/MotB domain protein [Bacteroidota bacterium]